MKKYKKRLKYIIKEVSIMIGFIIFCYMFFAVMTGRI